MFLIDSASSRPRSTLQGFSTSLLSNTLQKTIQSADTHDLQKPEIIFRSRQTKLPGFTKASGTQQDCFQEKYMKLVQNKGVNYEVSVFLDLTKKSHSIDVTPLQNIQSKFSVSKNISLHLLFYFATLNPQLNICSFFINPQTHRIRLSSAFIHRSKTVSTNKINQDIKLLIDIFDKSIDQLRRYVQEKELFSIDQGVKNQQILKMFPIIQQLLFTQSDPTQHCKQVIDEDLIVSKQRESNVRTIKVTHKLHKIYGTSNKLLNQIPAIPSIDIQRLQIRNRETVYQPLNSLNLKIQVQNPTKAWRQFYSNINTRIQVCDAKINLQNHPQPLIRSIVRKLPKTDSGQQQIQNSHKIYQKLKFKNCVNILKSYKSNQTQLKDSFITDYCKYGSLSNYLKTNKSSTRLRSKIYLLLQAAEALKFLKSESIVHMDIKPSNFLVASDFWLKLSDFGEAQFVNENSRGGWTVPYVSPERLRHQEVDFSSDIYSFGVMMYEVLTGKPLFIQRPSSKHQFQRNLQQQKIAFGISPESLFSLGPRQIMTYLYLLVVRCVNMDKQKRPSIEAVILILRYLIQLMEYLAIPPLVIQINTSSNLYSQ